MTLPKLIDEEQHRAMVEFCLPPWLNVALHG